MTTTTSPLLSIDTVGFRQRTLADIERAGYMYRDSEGALAKAGDQRLTEENIPAIFSLTDDITISTIAVPAALSTLTLSTLPNDSIHTNDTGVIDFPGEYHIESYYIQAYLSGQKLSYVIEFLGKQDETSAIVGFVTDPGFFSLTDDIPDVTHRGCMSAAIVDECEQREFSGEIIHLYHTQ